MMCVQEKYILFNQAFLPFSAELILYFQLQHFEKFASR